MDLIEDLIKDGHSVDVIAPLDDASDKIRARGIPFVVIRKLSRKGANPIQDIQLLLEFKRIYKSHQYDAILLYTIKPVIFGCLALGRNDIFKIATITGLGYTFLNQDYRSRIAKFLYRKALRKSDRVFFQNRDDLDLFRNLYLIASDKGSVVDGSGIDTRKIRPDERLEDNRVFKFLFVGRLLVDKGIRELLRAFRLISLKKKCLLEIIGPIDVDNPAVLSKVELEEYLKDERIEYLGQKDDVLKYMRECDVVVLPSYREGVPRVLLEAMALARPIIATDVPGCREVVHHGKNGFLCEPKNVDSLRQAMEKILRCSIEQRINMGMAGRIIVEERFDQKVISKKYLDLLRKLKAHIDK